MNEPSQLTTLFLTCPEDRAWLVISGDDQESRVLEMWNGYPNHWSASAWLMPGEYRCRYYGGDDSHVGYLGPARVPGCNGDGMDGLMSVALTMDEVNSGSIGGQIADDSLSVLATLPVTSATDN